MSSLPIDVWPVRGIGRLDDDRAVQTHLQTEVLSDMRVVPVEARVRELHLVGERLPDLDRCLGVMRNPVVSVLQTQAMPMNRCRDIAFVGHIDGDLAALVDVKDRTRDRSVVCEHPQIGFFYLFAYWTDVELEAVTVLQPDEFRTPNLCQSFGLVGERAEDITHLVRPIATVLHW